jgi:hypothetical protein
MLAQRQARARREGIGAGLLAAMLLCALLPSHTIGATARASPLRLRWQPAPVSAAPVVPAGGARAQFTLTNTGTEPLPARGWSLYFDCEEGVATGVAAGGFVFEQIAGTFYRMHPAEGFTGLDAGQSTVIPFTLLGPPQNLAEAPRGPYLAFDAAPARAQSITDYQVVAIPVRTDERTPEQTYDSNALQVQVSASELPPVLPNPQRYERRAGALRWTSMPEILAPAELHAEAVRVRALLKPYFLAPVVTHAERPRRCGCASGQSRVRKLARGLRMLRGRPARWCEPAEAPALSGWREESNRSASCCRLRLRSTWRGRWRCPPSTSATPRVLPIEA